MVSVYPEILGAGLGISPVQSAEPGALGGSSLKRKPQS